MNNSRHASPPGSRSALERRIGQFARTHGQTEARIRTTISQVVIASLMPTAFVKGGAGMKFRLGMSFTRDSKDLDISIRSELQAFEVQLQENLNSGWGPFTGKLKPLLPRHSSLSNYPSMHPYLVKLEVYGRDFQSVTLEVSWDELNITGTEANSRVSAADINSMFEELGLNQPAPINVISFNHQIAQKIHACTAPESDRAHDLIDLQLLWPENQDEVEEVWTATLRTFNWRRGHSFPRQCIPAANWAEIYRAGAVGLPVAQSLEEAIQWINGKLAEFPIT